MPETPYEKLWRDSIIKSIEGTAAKLEGLDSKLDSVLVQVNKWNDTASRVENLSDELDKFKVRTTWNVGIINGVAYAMLGVLKVLKIL